MLTRIKIQIAEAVAPLLEIGADEIKDLLEVPKMLEHGHISLPVFFLARTWKKAPPLIAKEVAEQINKLGLPDIARVEPLAGYVNVHLTSQAIQKVLMESVWDERLGTGQVGAGKTMVVDYASPNVAKPMSIGHLRATVIGQAICNLARSQGYDVVGLNHIGDWGVQFGKLAWAFQNWSDDYDFESKPFESLFAMYVRFHKEAEENKELDDKGSAVFKKLEDGDEEILKLWKKFIDISLVEYQRLWDMMGVRHDLVRGESFYNDKLAATEKILEDKGLLEESEGAMVVRLEEEMPPCLIRKSDGASLYATRDIASAIYRKEELKADLNLYVVGVDQSLHFKQVFQVLEKMGYDWASECHHISFGMYRFKDIGKMSTRAGNVIFLEDVLAKAIGMVQEIIEEKNPQLENKQKVAEQVGVGAILFNDLLCDRVKNVDFDWDKVLDFEGASGPYVQYTCVRCKSILKKYGQEIPTTMDVALESPEERALMRTLLNYDEVLTHACNGFKPHLIANYLLEVCRNYGHFYHSHRIIGGDEKYVKSRIALVFATQKVIEAGLKILNIECPEAM